MINKIAVQIQQTQVCVIQSVTIWNDSFSNLGHFIYSSEIHWLHVWFPFQWNGNFVMGNLYFLNYWMNHFVLSIWKRETNKCEKSICLLKIVTSGKVVLNLFVFTEVVLTNQFDLLVFVYNKINRQETLIVIHVRVCKKEKDIKTVERKDSVHCEWTNEHVTQDEVQHQVDNFPFHSTWKLFVHYVWPPFPMHTTINSMLIQAQLFCMVTMPKTWLHCKSDCSIFDKSFDICHFCQTFMLAWIYYLLA